MTPWILLVVFFPANGDGLVMGWRATYPTQVECRVAEARAVAQAGHGDKAVVMVSCVEEKP